MQGMESALLVHDRCAITREVIMATLLNRAFTHVEDI